MESHFAGPDLVAIRIGANPIGPRSNHSDPLRGGLGGASWSIAFCYPIQFPGHCFLYHPGALEWDSDGGTRSGIDLFCHQCNEPPGEERGGSRFFVALHHDEISRG